VSSWCLHRWIKERGQPAPQRFEAQEQSVEIRRLKAEFKRVTEERDILKKAAAYFAKVSG
jgi:transposase